MKMLGRMFLSAWFCMVWFVGGQLVVVTAQPMVSAWIVTPEADRIEGGQVEMRCVATNLEPDHVVEWWSRDINKTLRWGEHTITANSRFEFQTTHTGNGQTTQVITITDLQRDDTDEYVCNVRDPIGSGGHFIVANSSVMLSVLYFPYEFDPTCFPDGPITVDTGTDLNMRCISESRTPQVTLDIRQIPMTSDPYEWSGLIGGGKAVWRALTLTVDESHNNVTFNCTITPQSDQGNKQSCKIGPITVRSKTPTPTVTTSPTPASYVGLIAGASASAVAALVFILILILICQRRRTNNKRKTHKSSIDLRLNETGANRSTSGNQVPPIKPHGNINDENIDEAKIKRPDQSFADTGEPSYTPPVYARPHAKIHHESLVEAEVRASGQSLAGTAEQSYANPFFDSKNQDDISQGEHPTPPNKPLAMVPPMTTVPKKPQPYKPKAQRSSDLADQPPPQQYGCVQESTGRSTSTPASADLQDVASQDDVYSASGQVNPVIYQDTSYAQVTVPRQSSTTVKDPASENHLLYADLDFPSDQSAHDDESTAFPHSVVYAQVTKM